MLKFKVDMRGYDALCEALDEATHQAQHAFAEQAESDTRPFVPMLTGSLDMRSRAIDNVIVYPGPYARYLYYGKLMVDPDTGSPWASKGATKVLTDRNLVFTQAAGHRQAQSHWFEASKAQNLEKWVKVAAKAVTKYG